LLKEDPAFVQKIQAELAIAQVKEGTRSQVERGKIDFQAMQTAVEGRMEMQKIRDKGQPQAGAAPEQPTTESVLLELMPDARSILHSYFISR
jgi:hypothetical protein